MKPYYITANFVNESKIPLDLSNLGPINQLIKPNSMTTAQQIKVSIADDHKIFRDGIKMALKDREFLKILWEAEDGKDLMHKLKMKQPDVLLMDIRMPEVDGVNAIGMIRKEY